MIGKQTKKQTEVKAESKKDVEMRFTNVGRVSVTEFENTSKDGNVFSSFAISMSYKNDKDEYVRGNSYSLQDLISLRVAIDRAIDKVLNDKENEKEQ
jgi:hypothetical protein